MPCKRMAFVALLGVLPFVATASAEPTTRPAKPIAGILVGLDETSITIAPEATALEERLAPRSFSLDPKRVKVFIRREDAVDLEPTAAGLSDLRVGRPVTIIATNGVATVIRMFPPPPIGGELLEVKDGSITIGTRSSDGKPTTRILAVDSTGTKVLVNGSSRIASSRGAS